MADIGWQCLQDEWKFNEGAGFTAADDVLPPCITDEGIGPEHAMKFDVSADVVARAKAERFPVRDELWATKATG